MPIYTGTTGNDSWNLITPGTFTLDGLAGVDTLNLGTSLRSSYNITQASDGAVHIDSISGASAALHATLYNMEVLTFNSGRDVLDLRTYFGSKVPPTVSITDNTTGTAVGNVSYLMNFSETVTGLAANDFTVTNGSVVSVSGSGTSYSVVVAPTANTEASMSLTLNAASVTDSYGNINAATTAAAQPIDTKPPSVNSVTPANQSSGVTVGTDIVFTFSEAIAKGTGNITLTTSTGATVATYNVATSNNISVVGNTLTINPTLDLSIFSTYGIGIDSGAVKDLVGNSYAGLNNYSFTTQTIDSLYHFSVVAFSAAPGATFMGQMADAYNAGMTVKQIVEVFTTKSQFTSTYADSMTNTDFATLLVTNVVKDSASAATKAQAVTDIVSALGVWSRGDTIYQIFGNLANMSPNDATWGGTAQQFQNETAVAKYFTEVMHNTTTDMPTLKAVVAGVTAATDVSTPGLIASLIGVELTPPVA